MRLDKGHTHMRQVIQSLKTGQTEVVDVPTPAIQPGHALIKTCVSLVSTGTEKMLVDFGRANLFEKARSQPDRVTNGVSTDVGI